MCNIKFTRRDFLVSALCVFFLIAMTSAVGSSGKRRAQEAVCRANLRRLGSAVHAFAKDNGGRLFDSFDWVQQLEQYYENKNLLLCPEATKPLVMPYDMVLGDSHHAWAEEDNGRTYICSYGINQYCTSDPGGGRSWEELWSTIYAAGASKAPLMGDCANPGVTPQEHDFPPRWSNDIYPADGSDDDEIRSFCLDRHSAAVNCVYLDLSVRKVGLKSLWVQKWHRQWSLPPDPLPEWPTWMSNFKNP